VIERAFSFFDIIILEALIEKGRGNRPCETLATIQDKILEAGATSCPVLLYRKRGKDERRCLVKTSSESSRRGFFLIEA